MGLSTPRRKDTRSHSHSSTVVVLLLLDPKIARSTFHGVEKESKRMCGGSARKKEGKWIFEVQNECQQGERETRLAGVDPQHL